MADTLTKKRSSGATKRSVAKAVISPLSAAQRKAREAVERSQSSRGVENLVQPESLAEDLARVIERGLTPNPRTGTIDVPYAQGRITPSQLEEMQASEISRPLRVADAPNAPASANPRSPLLRARQSLEPDYFEPDRSAIINLSGDRSRVGKIYVDGNWYTIPGGADYGLTRGSGLWANAEDPALQIRDLGEELLARGVKPYGSYLTYGSFGSDSSLPFVQMARNMMEKQRRNNYRPVTEESIQALDDKIRSISKDGAQVYPDYPGALSPDLGAWLAKTFDHRNAFVQAMGAPRMMKDHNFPDLTAARRAMQDPRLRGLPNEGALIDDSGRKLYEGFGGHMIGALDTKAPVNLSATNWLPNQSFPTRVEGYGFGGFDQPIPRSLLFRDTVQNMRDMGKRPDKDYRPFQLAPYAQIIDRKWIDDIGRYIKRADEIGLQDMLINRYDDGGKVRGKIPAKIAGGLARFRDAPTKKIEDWKWRPMEDVSSDLAAPGALDIEGDTFKLPAHIHPFGDFMLSQAKRADTQGLTPRDLVKAYTTTRSSMQRQAINRENLERAGLPLSSSEQMIRPEGAFADWLKTPMGQRYLDAAVNGVPDADAINEARRVMKSFGFHNTLADDMVYAAQNIPSLTPQASDLVARAYHGKSEPQEWRDLMRGVKGIDAAKSGFMSSMLGRGDNPTLDARQIQLHTPDDDNLAKYGARSSQKLPMTGGDEAVERLAARQRLLGVEMPSRFDPMYQHLTHHGVWDATSGTKTTHQDIIDMMQGYEGGGRVKPLGERMKEMDSRSRSGEFNKSARDFLDAAALAMGTNLSRIGDDGRALDPLDVQYWNPTQGGPLGIVHQTVSFPSDLADIASLSGLEFPRLAASDMARENYSALKRKVAEAKGIALPRDSDDESWPGVIGDAFGTVSTQPFAAFSRAPKMAGALSRAARAIPEYIGPFIGMPWRANVAAGTAGGAALHGMSNVAPSFLESTMYSPFDPNDEARARIKQREEGAGMQNVYVPRAYAEGGEVSGSGMNLDGNAVEREALPKPEIPDLSNMSFEKAFATARRMGAPTFHWRRTGGKHNTFSTRVAESAGQIERRVNARTPAGPAPTRDAGATMMTPVAPPGGEDQQPGLPMGMPTRNPSDTERMRAMLDQMMREERTREAEMPSYLYSTPPSQMMSRGGALRRMQRAS